MRTGGTSWNSSKGPFLNDIYTEGGRGLTKCRRSKGGCVDLVLWILPKCRQRGGGGPKSQKLCRCHLSIAPNDVLSVEGWNCGPTSKHLILGYNLSLMRGLG